MATAVVIKVVSKHDKAVMRYLMKLLTASHGAKGGDRIPNIENGS